MLDLSIPLRPILFHQPLPKLRKLFGIELDDLPFKLLDTSHGATSICRCSSDPIDEKQRPDPLRYLFSASLRVIKSQPSFDRMSLPRAGGQRPRGATGAERTRYGGLRLRRVEHTSRNARGIGRHAVQIAARTARPTRVHTMFSRTRTVSDAVRNVFAADHIVFRPVHRVFRPCAHCVSPCTHCVSSCTHRVSPLHTLCFARNALCFARAHTAFHPVHTAFRPCTHCVSPVRTRRFGLRTLRFARCALCFGPDEITPAIG